MQTIYLSGASAELSLCEQWRDELILSGFILTLDWMRKIRNIGIADTHLDAEEQRHIARMDLQGVQDSEIFWLILPETSHTFGAWVELGYALGLQDRPSIVISGRWRSIFDQLADHRFVTHEDAFTFIQTFR